MLHCNNAAQRRRRVAWSAPECLGTNSSGKCAKFASKSLHLVERCAADGVILIIVCPRSLQALFAALRALGHRAVRRRPCTCDVLPAAVAPITAM